MLTSTSARDVLPNIDRTQAAEIDLDLQTRPSEGPNTSFVWICRESVRRFPRYPPEISFLSLVTLILDLLIFLSIPFWSMFELSASRATRGHPFKLAYPGSRINVRANSFPVRVKLIALWNRLPEYVVLASRLTTFKRLLRIVNMSYAILGKSWFYNFYHLTMCVYYGC